MTYDDLVLALLELVACFQSCSDKEVMFFDGFFPG